MNGTRLFRSRQSRVLLTFVWVALVSLPPLVIVLKITGVATGTNFYDFGAYYNAAERVLAGYPLYDWTTAYPRVTDLSDSPDGFLYAPVTVVLFLPFAALPHGVAAVAWVSLSAAAYVGAAYWFLRSLGVDLDARYWAMLFAAALGFGPFVTTTIAGQVSAILAALVMTAGALTLRGDDRHAVAVGAILAVVVAFKPYYAPVGAVLLRDRRRLAGAVVAGAAIVTVGLVIFSVDTSMAYLGVLQQGKGWGAEIDPVHTWNINEYHPLYSFRSVHFLVRGGGDSLLSLALRSTVVESNRALQMGSSSRSGSVRSCSLPRPSRRTR